MSARNMKLQRLDEIFSTEEMRQDDKRERVMELSPEELKPFKDHPFQVREDAEAGGRPAYPLLSQEAGPAAALGRNRRITNAETTEGKTSPAVFVCLCRLPVWGTVPLWSNSMRRKILRPCLRFWRGKR